MIIYTKASLSLWCVLVCVLFMMRAGTLQLIVLFGRESMAVVSTEIIPKMIAIWRALSCHINSFVTPVEDGFWIFCLQTSGRYSKLTRLLSC